MKEEITKLHYKDLTALGWGSRQTIWRKVRQGTFPPPRKFPDGTPGWLPEDLRDYIEASVTKR